METMRVYLYLNALDCFYIEDDWGYGVSFSNGEGLLLVVWAFRVLEH